MLCGNKILQEFEPYAQYKNILLKKRCFPLLNGKTQYNPLDIFFYQYLTEVETLIRQGLKKKYHIQEDNLKHLKGKIVFSKDIKHNSFNRNKTYCQHITFDYNHPIHTALRMALGLTYDLMTNSKYKSWAKRLLTEIPETTKDEISIVEIEKIHLDRTTKRYSTALEMAKLIIKSSCPDLSGGAIHVMSFLFDMNHLFEEFIFKITKKTLRETGYQTKKRKKYFWKNKIIRPDIVIEGNGHTIVLDTKWKIPSKNTPSDDDLKQIYVYNHYFRSPCSFLIYPFTQRLIPLKENCDDGMFHLPLHNDKESINHFCKVGLIDLFENTDTIIDMNGIASQIKNILKDAIKIK